MPLHLDTTATASLAAWATAMNTGPHGTEAVCRRAGAHIVGTDTVEFGVWIPHVRDDPEATVEIEVVTLPSGTDPTTTRQTLRGHRARFPTTVVGEFAWVVLTGVGIGTRHHLGDLYQYRVTPTDGPAVVVPDALGASFPFGAFAPAEVVDLTGERGDSEYFASLRGDVEEDGVPRIGHANAILQVHVGTATEQGTIAALTRRIQATADRLRRGEDPTAADHLWMGYDAVELLPVEPLIDDEAGPGFWIPEHDDVGGVSIEVGRPDMLDWGYDIPLCGGAAVNPAILETGRPHELIDLAVALHDFPTGPIGLIFDLVYGHADNQALKVMPHHWFTGPDMYGQHIDYQEPIVRTHLLEMQRRKGDFGADGLRIDGAQDFTWWDSDHNLLVRDDRYMREMSAVVQEVGGVRYRPWMIFEDGRPWPRADWELASTYHAVIDDQGHPFQWGPLTFAHNTPFLWTFWVSKWWRLREIADSGENWISGCANHDTLRRGSQVDPEGRINDYLGDTLPEVITRAYDHPAATLLFHGFLPGVPMDFLQGVARTPWSFIRTTDVRYAVKVWAEEARFLDWRVTEADYARPDRFTRLKGVGFDTRDRLHRFMGLLAGAVAVHGDDLDPVVATLGAVADDIAVATDGDSLVAAARAWMLDVHEHCTVSDDRLSDLDPMWTAFGLDVRRFRAAHPWLRYNLSPTDTFTYRHPTRGSVLFSGIRTSPTRDEQVLFVANMEGEPAEVVPTDLADVDSAGWQPVLVSPFASAGPADRLSVLPNGSGAIFIRRVG